MAISASFHRNVLLLSQVIKPSDEFKKYFREVYSLVENMLAIYLIMLPFPVLPLFSLS